MYGFSDSGMRPTPEVGGWDFGGDPLGVDWAGKGGRGPYGKTPRRKNCVVLMTSFGTLRIHVKDAAVGTLFMVLVRSVYTF